MSTVLFGLNTLILLASVARPHATLGIVLLLVVWLIGLGAIFFLWRRDSSGYYAASKAPWRRSGTPGSMGSTGAVRWRAWICGFSSTLNTAAFAGGAR